MLRILSVAVLGLLALCSTGCGHTAVSASTVDQALDLMSGRHYATCVTNHDFNDGYANYQCGTMSCDAMHDYRGADYISCKHQNMGEMGWERCVVVRDGEMNL